MLGNLFIVGLSTTNEEVLKKLILELHIGGLTLYSKNYKNYSEMLNLINYIRKLSKDANYNILICIDEEGGRVNRLPRDIINLTSPYSLRDKENNFKEYASITGEILSKSGIHLNFAPVLDIKRFPDNHAIGDRTFGDNLEDVIKNTNAYIKELVKYNIIPVIKHFPGHGASKINSHKLLPVIWDTKNLLNEDIIPFKEAIKNNIDTIMIGHILVKNFSLTTPASLSKKMINYLRNELNYQGIIITDDLDMGLLKLLPKTKLMKKALNSGANLITIKYTDTFFKDFKKLETEFQKGNLNKKHITDSLNKIDKLKIKYKVNNDVISNTLNINVVNERITKLNQKKISKK